MFTGTRMFELRKNYTNLTDYKNTSLIMKVIVKSLSAISAFNH